MFSNNDKLRVILVDDDADDRMLFEQAFSSLKIDSSLSLFNNGMEFVTHLDDSEDSVPDLIFLDLNMPMMGGIETLEFIRSSEKYRRVPVAIYSTSNNGEDIENTLVRGANIYITKPNNFDTLIKALDQVLKIQWQYTTSSLSLENYVMIIE